MFSVYIKIKSIAFYYIHPSTHPLSIPLIHQGRTKLASFEYTEWSGNALFLIRQTFQKGLFDLSYSFLVACYGLQKVLLSFSVGESGNLWRTFP